MAEITPELPDKAKEAKSHAAAATNVPALRDAVVELVDALEEAVARIAKLEKKIGR